MRIVINAVSATGGGGRSYLLNLARTLPALESHEYRLYAPASAAADLAALPANFETVTASWAEHGYAARLFWEQLVLPREAQRWKADALVCVGNFCPLRSAVPVVLLSRNSLYFVPRYLRDLLDRGHYGWAAKHLLMSRLAVDSARAARITVTPTAAMAEMIATANGNRPLRLRTNPHGFQPWAERNGRPHVAPPEPPPYRFLVVSHYNYFRNFETVFRAIALLRAAGERVHLVLSTQLRPGLRLGGYDTTRACRLLDGLGIRDAVTALGTVDYDHLPDLYRSGHAVICSSYAESFGQTLVEAMALGTPVIASDIPAHREVAAGAALFFSPFDPHGLADQCRSLMSDASLRARLLAEGQARAQQFSWRRHFQDLLAAVSLSLR